VYAALCKWLSELVSTVRDFEELTKLNLYIQENPDVVEVCNNPARSCLQIQSEHLVSVVEAIIWDVRSWCQMAIEQGGSHLGSNNSMFDDLDTLLDKHAQL